MLYSWNVLIIKMQNYIIWKGLCIMTWSMNACVDTYCKAWVSYWSVRGKAAEVFVAHKLNLYCFFVWLCQHWLSSSNWSTWSCMPTTHTHHILPLFAYTKPVCVPALPRAPPFLYISRHAYLLWVSLPRLCFFLIIADEIRCWWYCVV